MDTVNLRIDYTNKSAKWTTNNGLPTRDVWLPTPGTVLRYDRFVLKNPGRLAFDNSRTGLFYLDLNLTGSDSAIVRRFNLDGSLQLGSYALPAGVPYTGISPVPSSTVLIAVFNSSGTGSIEYRALASPGTLSSTPFTNLTSAGFTMLSNIYLVKDSASADRPISLVQQIIPSGSSAGTYNILKPDAANIGQWVSTTLATGGAPSGVPVINLELFKFITVHGDQPTNNYVTVLSQRTADNPSLPLTWWIRTFQQTLVASVPTLTLLGSAVQITFPSGAVTPTGISVVYNVNTPSNSRLFVSFQENLVAQYTIFPFSTVGFVKVYGSAAASSEFGYFNNPVGVLAVPSESTAAPRPQFYVIEQGNKRISYLTANLTTPWNYLSSWGTPVLNSGRLQVSNIDPLLSISATRRTSNDFVYTLNNLKTVYQYDTNGVYTGVSVTATLNAPKLVVAGINFDGFYVLDQDGSNQIILRAFNSAGTAVGTPLSTGITTTTLGFNMAVVNTPDTLPPPLIDNIYFIASNTVRAAAFSISSSAWVFVTNITLPAFGTDEVPRFVGFDFNPQTNDSSLHVITNRPGDGRVSVYAYSLSGITGTLRTGTPWNLNLTSGLASANVDNYGRITFQDLTSPQLRMYQPTVPGNYTPGNYIISSFGSIVTPSALGGNLTTDNLGHTYILESTTASVNANSALPIYSFQIMSTLLDLGWNFDTSLNVANCQMEKRTALQASDFVIPANLVSGSCYNILRDADVGTTSVIAPTIRTKLNNVWLRSVTPNPSNSAWNVMWQGASTVEADFMSGACCVGQDTLVMTKEFGEIPILNIRAGQHVWDVQQRDWVKVEKNIRFTTPVRHGVVMSGRSGEMFIMGDHPVLHQSNGIIQELPAKNFVGQPGVSRAVYDVPVYVHTLCTTRRAFVLMQGQFAVGAWSEAAWENYLLNDKTRVVFYDCI